MLPGIVWKLFHQFSHFNGLRLPLNNLLPCGMTTSLPFPLRNFEFWTFQPYPCAARNICDVKEAFAVKAVEEPRLLPVDAVHAHPCKGDASLPRL